MPDLSHPRALPPSRRSMGEGCEPSFTSSKILQAIDFACRATIAWFNVVCEQLGKLLGRFFESISTTGERSMPATFPSDGEVTFLLDQVRVGEAGALDRLTRLVLSNGAVCLAHSKMMKEPSGHLLQTADLVDKALLRLIKGKVIERSPNRRYLFAAAGRAMHALLVDHAQEGDEPIDSSAKKTASRSTRSSLRWKRKDCPSLS